MAHLLKYVYAFPETVKHGGKEEAVVKQRQVGKYAESKEKRAVEERINTVGQSSPECYSALQCLVSESAEEPSREKGSAQSHERAQRQRGEMERQQKCGKPISAHESAVLPSIGLELSYRK